MRLEEVTEHRRFQRPDHGCPCVVTAGHGVGRDGPLNRSGTGCPLNGRSPSGGVGTGNFSSSSSAPFSPSPIPQLMLHNTTVPFFW